MSFYENESFSNNLDFNTVSNMQPSITRTRSWKVLIVVNLFNLKVRPIKICQKDLNKSCLIGY